MALPGVFPTGVAEKGYDGPEAEHIREERVVQGLISRDPELLDRVRASRDAARKAQADWDALRLTLAGSVGTDGVRDVLVFLDREITEAQRKAEVASIATTKTVQSGEFYAGSGAGVRRDDAPKKK